MSWTLLLLLSILGHAHAGDDNNTEEHPWEWAGIVNLTAGEPYSLVAMRNSSGAYISDRMQVVFAPAASADAAGLAAAEEVAAQLWLLPDVNQTQVRAGGLMAPGSSSFQLLFDPSSWLSLFQLQVQQSALVALFLEHAPEEFENGLHFLKDHTGADVEPLFTEGVVAAPVAAAAADASLAAKSGWGLVIGGSLVTVLPAVFGVLIVLPPVLKRFTNIMPWLSSFASGTILAAAVFLLLPEGLHLAGEGQTEATAAWTWGLAILLGWFSGPLVHHAGHAFCGSAHEHDYSCTTDVEASQGAVPAKVAIEKDGKQQGSDVQGCLVPVAVPILLGSFFHSFADGLFIGLAVKVCGSSFTWGMVGMTVAHELPHQISDYVVLAGPARMRWYWSLLANVFASLGTVWGAILTYQVDVSSNANGLIMAFGAGAFLFVSTTQLGPVVAELGHGRVREPAMRLLLFALGATCIGLVVMNHTHCEGAADVASAGADAGHAGHSH